MIFVFMIIESIICSEKNKYGSNKEKMLNHVAIHFNKSYIIVENTFFKKRTIDIIKNEYKKSLIHPFSACKNSHECQPKTYDKCKTILPSTDDHTKSLKFINFIRELAGISTNIIEDEMWSQQCYKAAINIQKLGKVPSDHLIKSEQATDEFCGDSSNVHFTNNSKLNIVENSFSFFETLKKTFINEKVDDQILLLHPNLKKVGFGYYPFRIEKVNDFKSLKPSITVIKTFDQNFNFSPKFLNTKFISWPPEGPFPIELLQSKWLIMHNDFENADLNDIKIFIYRDDGIQLKIESKSKSIKNNALIIHLKQKEMEKCQIKRETTVTVINEQLKKIYRFSFVLFKVDHFSSANLTLSEKVNKNKNLNNSTRTCSYVKKKTQNRDNSNEGLSNDDFAFIIQISPVVAFVFIIWTFSFLTVRKQQVENEVKGENEEEEINERNQTNQVNQPNQTNQVNQDNQVDQENRICGNCGNCGDMPTCTPDSYCNLHHHNVCCGCCDCDCCSYDGCDCDCGGCDCGGCDCGGC